MTNMILGAVYALLAGFLGAVASSFAKLFLGADYLKVACDAGMRRWVGETHWSWSGLDAENTPCDWLPIPLRLMCGGLLFTCNAVMWTFFSKALCHSSSSVGASVTTAASNFISSAFLGRMIFGETHTTLWWMGISLTLSGLLVLYGSTQQAIPREEDKKEN